MIDEKPTSSLDSESVRRTTTGFWDNQWSVRADSGAIARWLRSRDFGENGFFIRLMRYLLPGKFRDASVVELGGAVSKFLVDLSLLEGATVTAIDYSDVGVQQTRQLFKDMGVTGEVLQADIFAMHAGEKTYDIVTHWGLLEHFSEPRAVLKACHGLLRADGLVVFSMPNMEAYGAGLWRLLAPDNYSAHVHHSSEVVAKACSDVGLQLEREFFCGPPLIRMAPAERLRIVAILVDLLHSFVLLIGLVAPSMYLRGARKISNTRGFVARRVVNPS